MKSRPYEFYGKTFRYDYETAIVEHITKASSETVKENEEWKAAHNGRPLFDIDESGYIVLESVGLHQENWKNRSVRDEYLIGWCIELDEELDCMIRDFERFEMQGEIGYGI